MPIIRCENGPFAGHIAFVREGCARVELYDVHFLSTPEPYILGMGLGGEPLLRWARVETPEQSAMATVRAAPADTLSA